MWNLQGSIKPRNKEKLTKSANGSVKPRNKEKLTKSVNGSVKPKQNLEPRTTIAANRFVKHQNLNEIVKPKNVKRSGPISSKQKYSLT